MSTPAQDHLHTQTGEHVAIGRFARDTDAEGTLQVEGPYPELRANTLYEIRIKDGSVIPLFDVKMNPDPAVHTYHVKLKPESPKA